MKKHSFQNYRKSICTTSILNKQNINHSLPSIRSYSKSVRKLKIDKPPKDWQTIQTILTPTSKSHLSSYLPRISQKRTVKLRDRSCKTIPSIEEIPYKFTKILGKRGRKYKTLDLSIDIELERLKSLTQNCSKLLNDLSDIQQRRIVSQYRSVMQEMAGGKVIEV